MAARRAPPAAHGLGHLSPCQLFALCCALELLAAFIFTRGFLVTRLELLDRSDCADVAGQSVGTHAPAGPIVGCCSPPQFNKTVILIIDALRDDFVVGRPGQRAQSHVGRMPQLLQLVHRAGQAQAGLLARFTADNPAITTSRLKALLTGSVPTLLDLGDSFAAQQLREDNLVSQLMAAGRRLVFMGDDSWRAMLPTGWASAHFFPSLVVHDLHTVDDGVWEASACHPLLPLLHSSSTCLQAQGPPPEPFQAT